MHILDVDYTLTIFPKSGTSCILRIMKDKFVAGLWQIGMSGTELRIIIALWQTINTGMTLTINSCAFQVLSVTDLSTIS